MVSWSVPPPVNDDDDDEGWWTTVLTRRGKVGHQPHHSDYSTSTHVEKSSHFIVSIRASLDTLLLGISISHTLHA